jgi:putative transposase
MGNHFHLLLRMHPGSEYTDKQIKKRYKDFFKGNEENKDRELTEGQVEHFRSKWQDLSEFVRDIKQGFSRFYNKRHDRRGFFWSERFTLLNCK